MHVSSLPAAALGLLLCVSCTFESRTDEPDPEVTYWDEVDVPAMRFGVLHVCDGRPERLVLETSARSCRDPAAAPPSISVELPPDLSLPPTGPRVVSPLVDEPMIEYLWFHDAAGGRVPTDTYAITLVASEPTSPLGSYDAAFVNGPSISSQFQLQICSCD